MLEKIKIALRKADLGDVERICGWASSQDFVANLYDLETKDPKKLKARVIAMVEKSTSDPSDAIVMIAETPEKPVGMILYSRINWRSRNLHESTVIGEEEYKNKIYGLKFIHLMLDFAFKDLGMHKISGYVYDFNSRMSALLEGFGAIKEGYFKDFVKRGDKKYGATLYAFFDRNYPRFLKAISKY